MCSTADVNVPIDLVVRSPYRSVAPSPSESDLEQFRKNDPEPCIVRKIPDGRFEILVGEAAWRLVQAASLHTIKVRILEGVDDRAAANLAKKDAVSDQVLLTSAFAHLNLENRERNCAEKLLVARQIEAACSEPGTSRSAAGKRFGLSPSEVSHYLRVLKLPEAVRNYGMSGQMSFAQLRALSRISNIPSKVEEIALQIVKAARGLRYRRASSVTVRDIERLVDAVIHSDSAGQGADEDEKEGASQTLNTDASQTSGLQAEYVRGDSNICAAERKLTDSCGHRVEIDFDPRTKSGWLRIRFGNLDEYEAVSDLIAPTYEDFE